MTVADRLAAFARGDAAHLRAVLHNCRTAAFGTTAFGREETAALFRALPLTLDPDRAVVTPALVALFGEDANGKPAALFADVLDDHVMRLWGLGTVRHPAPLSDATGVPIDLDLDQRGGCFQFVSDDFPLLSPSAAATIRQLGQHWIDAQPAEIVGPLERARPILLRAASAGERSAALLLLQGHAGPRGISRFAAGMLIDDATTIVLDVAGRTADSGQRRVTTLRPPGCDQAEPAETPP